VTLSIGAVVAELRKEFPDLRESKIRFLESSGLVTPERTASGYRRYSDEDVDVLRRVLRLQRDNFWPLRVIADHIRSGAPDEPGGVAAAAAPVRPVRRGTRIGRETLMARAHVDGAVLDELESYGLVAPDDAGRYNDSQVEIATIAGALVDFGLHPRHLRPTRVSADREVGLLRQAAAGAASTSGEREAALVDLLVRLHAALLWSGLGHDGPRPAG
jgi:DNA-binding transcriptional MerR regulator